MSRDWLLYLDDLIASAEKIARLLAGRDLAALRADEAAYDARRLHREAGADGA